MALLECTCMLSLLGKKETPLDMLRSILAQLQYHHDIMEWENKGVPFCSRMYVPEVHPLTGNPFNEREDEAHVFKIYIIIFRYT